MNKGTLFLIPNTLGDTSCEKVIPSYNSQIINSIDTFIVEDVRSARRFLKRTAYQKNFDDVTFFVLNEHTSAESIPDYLKPLQEGKNTGIISEAGIPCIADPGAEIVKLAHEKNIKVVPLVGPSSIMLALMASGMNGQNFVFHGYLPKEQKERVKKIKELEIAAEKNKTQVFIETPYRNSHMIDDLLHSLSPSTLLCIACDVSLESEFISTKKISEWKKEKPDMNKRPAVFLIGK